MTGMKNRIRRYARANAANPVVVGLAAVGDAAATSNPAHSRGCSLALIHAAATADALADTTAPGAATMRALDAVLDRVLVPWVEDSIEQDLARLSRWRRDGPPAPACHERAIVAPRAHVCVSAAVAAELCTGWGIEATIIPNGVDADRFAAGALDADGRAAWRRRIGAP